MRKQLVIVMFVLSVSTSIVEAAGKQGSSAAATRTRAYELAYSLDHDEAAALLERSVAENPSDAANHRALAAIYWLKILFLRGTVTVDDYLGRVTRSQLKMKPPPADLAGKFRQHADRAVQLAEQQAAKSPRDAIAHYEVGASVGLIASYTATIEGKLLAGFQAARRAYQAHEQVLELSPARKDASLIVGLYRYIVSTLAMPVRWMAYVVGFGGGKERGIQMIEESARFSSDAQTEARFALVLLYNRERRYADALRQLELLQRQFPRNRVIWLEVGATNLRAGKPAEAEAALNEGMAKLAADKRPRMLGEEALWRYKRGAARVALKKTDAAVEDLTLAVRAEGRDWVRGRAHLELAKVAQLRNDTARAHAEFDRATTLCTNDSDSICLDEIAARRK